MFVVENWGVPHYIYATIAVINIICSAILSGEQMTHGSFGGALVLKFIQITILAFGGFFDSFNWPQVVWAILTVIGLGRAYTVSRQEYKESLFRTIISYAFTIFILAMGGFFA